MAGPQKQWGVTPPISLSLPTDSELATNDALIAELKKQNNFESVEETERRYVAVQGVEATSADKPIERPPYSICKRSLSNS